MIDISILRAMAAAGATVEIILAAIETAQTAQAIKQEARRAKDAERQRRRRVRVTSRDTAGPSDAVCDPPQHILPPQKNSEPKKVLRSMPTRKAALPTDFRLSETAIEFAMSKGWTTAYLQSEFARFCDNAVANNRKYADWEAAWRNWVTSPYQTNGKANGKHSGNGISDAFDKLIAEATERERQGDSGGEGQTILRPGESKGFDW